MKPPAIGLSISPYVLLRSSLYSEEDKHTRPDILEDRAREPSAGLSTLETPETRHHFVEDISTQGLLSCEACELTGFQEGIGSTRGCLKLVT